MTVQDELELVRIFRLIDDEYVVDFLFEMARSSARRCAEQNPKPAPLLKLVPAPRLRTQQ